MIPIMLTTRFFAILTLHPKVTPLPPVVGTSLPPVLVTPLLVLQQENTTTCQAGTLTTPAPVVVTPLSLIVVIGRAE